MALAASAASAAPYAAMVMDARSGEVLHSRNADTRLHPASLTKMMTLYVAFDAVRRGEITLDTKVRVSSNAAAEPPSKLHLKAGQRIELRYLIRASAVKSANDAATAIAEAISGSEAAFTRRMTRTARALGMKNTTFKNAHGLTQSGHLSTARDMTILGRHVLYDFPEYYNLFSRQSTDAKVRVVRNTNRRLLNSYKGADGIKTGYTRAAGFNLVASAQRGQERIIATVFGGKSGASRDRRVAELLDMGFSRAPSQVAVRKPNRPNVDAADVSSIAVARSARPLPRLRATSTEIAGAEVAKKIEEGLQMAQAASAAARLMTPAPRPEGSLDDAGADIAQSLIAPDTSEAETAASASLFVLDATPETEPVVSSSDYAAPASPPPQPRPVQITFSSADTPAPASDNATLTEVIVPQSVASSRFWGINVGTYNSRYEAERVLLKTALIEIETLDTANREVVRGKTGFEARFIGLDERSASLACARLNAREQRCDPIGPGT
ncbi:MAG: D-alanyl-D-alanine carboxypeptidase family protein [Pseudomonadota bacterium]